MLKISTHINFIFSPLESAASANYKHGKANGSNAALSAYIEELQKMNEEMRQSRRAALNMMEDAILSKEALRKSEEKYRALFNSIDEGFAIQEVVTDENGNVTDVIYLEVNRAFEQLSGMKDVPGKKASELLPHLEQHWLDTQTHIYKTGEPLHGENYTADLDKWIAYYFSRIGGAGSPLIGVVFNDITERKQREQQQQFLIKFSDALRAEPDADAIANRAIKMVAEHLHLDRCYVGIALLDDNQGMFPYQFGNERVAPMPQGGVSLSDFPEALRRTFDETLVITDFQNTEGLTDTEKENFATLGFGALVVANVRKEGNRPNWSINAVTATPRHWTPLEVQLIEEVTERTWAAIERAKAEEALHAAEKQHREELEKKVEERTRELSASKELIQATMNASMDMIQVFEAVRNEKKEIVDFKWILNNHKAEKYYGDVIGKSLLTLNPGVIEEGIFDTFKKVVETGIADQREHHYVHEQFNGWYCQSVVKLGDGVATTTTDITEKKIAEEEIKKQSNYIERITQTVPGMISVMELETGKIEYINDKVFKAQGFNPQRMKKTSRAELRQAIHEDDHEKLNRYYTAFESVKDHEAVTVDYRAKTDAGSWQWYRVRGKVFQRNAEGKVTHIVNNVENVTKEKEAEEKINTLNNILTAKNRALESANAEIRTFNSIAATDYKETLRQLYTSLEYIITHDAKNISDSGKANIRRAQAGIQKMKLLTDDIINFSKIQTLDSILVNTDLNEIIEKELALMQEKISANNVEIQTEDMPVIKGYPLLLSLLFHHLIDNAIKFRKPDIKTFISIEYENPEQPGDAAANNYHKISIIDNGIGFDKNDTEKIFGMFSKLHDKSKYRGSGIGLAICKKIMDLHNGYIEAKSNIDVGSMFTCFFPKDI